jgi:hypothetical protein
MSERNAREYVVWHNAYVRTLRELGMKAAAERAPSLEDYAASRASTPPPALADEDEAEEPAGAVIAMPDGEQAA